MRESENHHEVEMHLRMLVGAVVVGGLIWVARKVDKSRQKNLNPSEAICKR